MAMTLAERVRTELQEYEHPLVEFSVEELVEEEAELRISLKDTSLDLHTYVAPLHPRDLEGAQFTWNLQRYLYACLHDFIVELFSRTPQERRGQ